MLRRFKPGVTADDYLRVIRETGSVDEARRLCCLPAEPVPDLPAVAAVRSALRAFDARPAGDVFDPATGENLSEAFRPGGRYFDPCDVSTWANYRALSGAEAQAVKGRARQLASEPRPSWWLGPLVQSGASRRLGRASEAERLRAAGRPAVPDEPAAPSERRFASVAEWQAELRALGAAMLDRAAPPPLPAPSGQGVRAVCPLPRSAALSDAPAPARPVPDEPIDRLVKRTRSGVTLADLSKLEPAPPRRKPRAAKRPAGPALSPMERARLKPKRAKPSR